MPNTKGFRPLELLQHFADHGAEFGATQISEYARIADELWSDPKPAHVEQCKRKGGDTVRFDTVTQTYSVVDSAKVIRTLFKPIPCGSIPVVQRTAARKAGKCHGAADNLTYFHERCRQW